ncbi:MAG TPA: CHAD domain-containing protein [Candidatus Nitrosotalea sp.]|nr:CHAD domain-containing protein [Candidatus Nitrosotalea sp.]
MPEQDDHAKLARAGLRFWMQRVLQQARLAMRDPSPEAIHDLRVALRRCRSMAAGLAAVDPYPAWNEMRKASRKLFRRLGELRDLQVLQEWLNRLSDESDPVRQSLAEVFSAREPELKTQVAKALGAFDRTQWTLWSRAFPDRARRLVPDGLVAQHLALESWEKARALHRRALRNHNPASWHALRIGLKRFRYTAENFLPGPYAGWAAGLKRIQDLLGDVHDLDVLSATLPEAGPVLDAAAETRWRAAIEHERTPRLDEYRATMAGRNSLWSEWRSQLLPDDRIEAAGIAKLTLWAMGLDPDTMHSRQVARLSLELFDGLGAAGFNGTLGMPRARVLLHAAALLHNVGRSESDKGHHKASYRLIRALDPPLGWTAEEIERVAIVARYHCGAEPRDKHPSYGALAPEGRSFVRMLAGILRVADALDDEHDGAVRRLEIQSHAEYVLIRASGWQETEQSAATIGGRKHLLESALGRPIIVRANSAREPTIISRPGPRAVSSVAD